jgi:hypothetical protein
MNAKKILAIVIIATLGAFVGAFVFFATTNEYSC